MNLIHHNLVWFFWTVLPSPQPKSRLPPPPPHLRFASPTDNAEAPSIYLHGHSLRRQRPHASPGSHRKLKDTLYFLGVRWEEPELRSSIDPLFPIQPKNDHFFVISIQKDLKFDLVQKISFWSQFGSIFIVKRYLIKGSEMLDPRIDLLLQSLEKKTK